MDFTRQTNIFDPENQNLDITIIGAGSTGSFTALNLAKMGFNKIKVIDFDTVEKHNIPNQFFRMQDIGKPKVDALQEIIKDFTGTEIQVENLEIKEDYEFDLGLNTLILLCVDSIDVRKLIFEKVKEFPIMLMDTRFGGEGFSIHTVNLSETKENEKFAKSLNLKIKDTTCGAKSIIYTILSLASEVCNIIKKMEKEEAYPKLLKRELKTYNFIGKSTGGKNE